MLHNEILRLTKEAFAPLKCGAEIWDYDFKIKFRVLDENDNEVLDVPDLIIKGLKEQDFVNILKKYRKFILDKNLTLNKWL